MNILLDTHTLLWSIGKSDELSGKVVRDIENINNNIFVSAVSLWEIALKTSIGKLDISFPVADIPNYCNIMKFSLLPLDPLDALDSKDLPFKGDSKDPFDRLLIHQCIKHNYALVSRDRKIKAYKECGLVILW